MRTIKVFLIGQGLKVKTEIRGDSRKALFKEAIEFASKVNMSIGSIACV